MRRADFCRREQARRRRIAHAPKVSQDGLKTEGDVTGDVFEENPFGLALDDDAGDLGPEVPGIVGTSTLSGRAEGLAGISGEEDVKSPTEGMGIEAVQIVPDRRGGEVSRALGCDEDGAGICLPLDKCAGVIAGLSEHDAQIKASAACAEGKSVPGT